LGYRFEESQLWGNSFGQLWETTLGSSFGETTLGSNFGQLSGILALKNNSFRVRIYKEFREAIFSSNFG